MSKHEGVRRECDTCRYFDPFWVDGDPPPHTGDCNRYPPEFVASALFDHRNDAPVDIDMWAVPHVGAHHRCGEWKRRKDGR